MLAHRKADEQGIAARCATPLRAFAVCGIRAAGRLAVQLIEGLLRAAPAAVHRQLDHPGDLLSAVQHDVQEIKWG
jgi:hypothetical protein